MGGSVPGLVTRLHKWAAHPFANDLDLMGVSLTVGLVIVLAFVWTRILGEIVAE